MLLIERNFTIFIAQCNGHVIIQNIFFRSGHNWTMGKNWMRICKRFVLCSTLGNLSQIHKIFANDLLINDEEILLLIIVKCCFGDNRKSCQMKFNLMIVKNWMFLWLMIGFVLWDLMGDFGKFRINSLKKCLKPKGQHSKIWTVDRGQHLIPHEKKIH